MPICQKCGKTFPNRIVIDGKARSLNHRKFCLDCSPFGEHNTKDIVKSPRVPKEERIAERKRKNVLQVGNRRRKLMDMAIEYKGGKCAICGYDRCKRAFDFHHIDPSQKEFGIAEKGITRSWEALKKELDKCVLLCSNCHMEVEDGITQLPKDIGR